jgi:hypothetical protein
MFTITKQSFLFGRKLAGSSVPRYIQRVTFVEQKCTNNNWVRYFQLKLISNWLFLHRVCLLHSGASSNIVAKASSVKSGSHDVQRQPTAKMANLMDIGSRNLFGPEQDSFRETVRKFIQREIIPHSHM